MLETVKLEERLKKGKWKALLDESLGNALGQVQRDARNVGLPVIILFEGWRHSRRSEIVGKMMQFMDARGFRVFSSAQLDRQSRELPFLRRIGNSCPSRETWLSIAIPGITRRTRASWKGFPGDGHDVRAYQQV